MNIVKFIQSNKTYFEDYITRSTYHSNAIEGSTLSYAETYAILFNDNSFKVSVEPREIYEAINHKYALSYVINHIEEKASERMLKEVAILLNKNIMEISGYRTRQVLIKGAEYIPPEPQLIPQLMMHFVHNYHNTVYDSVFDKIATNHLQFERIHPFTDGNGRTGRLLINYELLRNDIPPAIIPKEERSKYFAMLADSDVQALSQFLETLSNDERDRMKKFVDV